MKTILKVTAALLTAAIILSFAAVKKGTVVYNCGKKVEGLNICWHMLTDDGKKVSVKDDGCKMTRQQAIDNYKATGADWDGWKIECN